MRFNILGPLEVLDSAGDPLTISGLKERTVLAVLVVNRGKVVSVDRLIEALWHSKPPSKPMNALQARLSNLRRQLGSDKVIVTRTPGYLLEARTDDVDAHRFECLVSEARKRATEDPEAAIAIYDEALGIWRGPALDDFSYDDFARPEVTRLEELRVTVLEERIEALLEAGQHKDAVAELEGLAGAHPWREAFWRQLMIALYRSGRQAEALRAFGEARRILGEELGIEPSEELRGLEELILMQDKTLDRPDPAAGRPRHNLPVRLTSLVGRDSDLARVVGLLGGHRSITLVGPGGVGKTSLALACAGELVPSFADGVWLVDLSALEEHSQVPVELARSLEVDTGDRSTLEATTHHLRGKNTLIVLDNCEHLLTGVAETAAAILRHAPNVKVLATSREPLGIPGEVLWPTRPLRAPSEVEETSTDHDAVRLFVDRATAADPDFRLGADNRTSVGFICRRLDGLPLAVELAAARVRALTVAEIAHHLEDRFSILTGTGRAVVPRQQTLEATVAWSYELLSEEERRLLARLSVFAGGWSLDAARAVAAEPDRTLQLLTSLVDRSLVSVDRTGDETRYAMLETIRAFASKTLDETGEKQRTALNHARWFLGLAEKAELQGRTQSHWTTLFSAEHENLRAAITYASEFGDHKTALDLAAALGWWWFFGNREEGRSILDDLLNRTQHHAGAYRVSALNARALQDFFGASSHTFEVAEEALAAAEQGNDAKAAAMSKVFVALSGVFAEAVERSLRLLDEAIAVFAAERDRFAEGLARFQRMEVLGNRGSLRHALDEGDVALEYLEEAGDPWAVSVTLGHLGRYGRLTGELARAEEATAASVEIAGDRSLPHTLQYSLTDQGYLAYIRGHLAEALRTFEEALSIARTVGNRMGVATISNGIAEVLLAEGVVDEARRLHSEAAERFAELELSKWRAYSLTRVGLVEEHAGNWQEAAEHHLEASRAMTALPGSISTVLSLEGLARVAATHGDLERSAHLLQGAKELRQRGGLAPTPTETAANEEAELHLRNSLSAETLRSIARETGALETTAIAALAS